MYYFDTYTYYKNEPISLPGDLKDIATIFARLTLLLIGADACTPHIINLVWGEDDDARLALGGPCGDLSLTRRHLLTLSKVAINTVHIWLTDPTTPILAPTSDNYDRLPSTLRQLLLHSSYKLVFAREPVPRGTKSVDLLMKNLQNHKIPNTLTFKENAIIWYRSILLNQAHTEHRRHDQIRHRHPHRIRNVPASGISQILSDGSSNTTDTLYAGHTHQSMGR
jgi:hypothetical protein